MSSRSLKVLVCLLALSPLIVACGGGGSSDNGGGGTNPPPPPASNHNPRVSSVTVTGGRSVGTSTTFNWAIDDPDGDALSCRLDVNGDWIFEYEIDPCPPTGS